MDNFSVSIALSVLALVIAVVALFFSGRRSAPAAGSGVDTTTLRLQAYERLVLLCERIALPNLISRTAAAGLSAREMQYILNENIKQEFEYNATQQIYVSARAWEAVRQLRDQNMLVINHVGNALPQGASSGDLNRQLLEVIMSQEEKALHTMVLEILNGEAKRLMP
jgi:hypothetical protein